MTVYCGLCVRWGYHDEVIAAIAQELEGDDSDRELAAWLLTRLPGSDDLEHLGYAVL
jgi:hypothetical protein